MDITKIQLDKWYSLSDLARLKPLPVNNNRETLAKVVEADIQGANILKTHRTPWKIKGYYTYRIQGKNIINFVAMEGWNQKESN